jgi:hypothetical protein
VKELIVDPAAMTTRYLDAEVSESKLELEPLNRHILIPAQRVRLDRSEKHVVLDGVFGRDLKDYPIYQGLPLDRSAERAIDEVFMRPRTERRDTELASTRFFGVRTRTTGAGEPLPVRSRRRREETVGRDIERVASETRYETIAKDSEEVRIHIRGDDIIIERHPRGGNDDG